jgi:hypothetical protein
MMKNFFKGFTVEHIERAKNTKADELAKAVFFQVIEDPSVKTVKPESRMVNIMQGENW